jgi:S1-C subfamily serine protease
MTLFRLLLITIVSCLFISLLSLSSYAQQEVHTNIRKNLVAITVTAKDSKGSLISAFGTGFVIHPDGYVLTTSHIVDGLTDAIITTIKYAGQLGDLTNNAIEMNRVTDTRDFDLLVLKLRDRMSGYDPVSLEDISNTKKVEVYTSGFAETCVTTPTDTASSCNNRKEYYTTGGPGHVTSTDVPPPYTYIWATDLTVNKGNSGSPVYLTNGKVVGVAKVKLSDADNTYYFIPIGFAQTAIGGLHISIPLSQDVAKCTAEQTAKETIETFTKTGGARAPSNGAQFASVDAVADVCYQAPPGWKISGSVNIVDGGTNGGRGWIGPAKYTDSSVCVTTKAWSDSVPFGAGGWQYATLTGQIQRTLTNDERAVIERACASR